MNDDDLYVRMYVFFSFSTFHVSLRLGLIGLKWTTISLCPFLFVSFSRLPLSLLAPFPPSFIHTCLFRCIWLQSYTQQWFDSSPKYSHSHTNWHMQCCISDWWASGKPPCPHVAIFSFIHSSSRGTIRGLHIPTSICPQHPSRERAVERFDPV